MLRSLTQSKASLFRKIGQKNSHSVISLTLWLFLLTSRHNF